MKRAEMLQEIIILSITIMLEESTAQSKHTPVTLRWILELLDELM